MCIRDRCAAVSVLPEDQFHDYPLKIKGKGRKYNSASNHSIVDRGSRSLKGILKGRSNVSNFDFRVCKVRRALMCVSQLVDSKHKIVFDADEPGKDCS